MKPANYIWCKSLQRMEQLLTAGPWVSLHKALCFCQKQNCTRFEDSGNLDRNGWTTQPVRHAEISSAFVQIPGSPPSCDYSQAFQLVYCRAWLTSQIPELCFSRSDIQIVYLLHTSVQLSYTPSFIGLLDAIISGFLSCFSVFFLLFNPLCTKQGRCLDQGGLELDWSFTLVVILGVYMVGLSWAGLGCITTPLPEPAIYRCIACCSGSGVCAKRGIKQGSKTKRKRRKRDTLMAALVVMGMQFARALPITTTADCQGSMARRQRI